MKRLVLVLSLLVSMNARADWHTGTLLSLGFGYDGQSLVLALNGLNKTTCTCYSPWPGNLCVARSRQDFKEIYAFLLKARVMKTPIEVNIDETTCYVQALYETD
jgi:hypothetical protein